MLSDLPTSVAQGRLTPDEASQVSGIVSKRAELFGAIELATEIEALKDQLAAVVGSQRAPSPIRPFAITLTPSKVTATPPTQTTSVNGPRQWASRELAGSRKHDAFPSEGLRARTYRTS